MRNYNLLSPLAERNELHIVSAKFRYSKYPGQYDNRGANIYQSVNIDYRSVGMMLRFLFGKRTHSQPIRKGLWMRKVMDSFPTHMLLGEGGIAYILHAYYLAIKIIRRNKITCIYASFRTHADQVVAAMIKYSQKDLIWIADFADFPIDPIMDNSYAPRLQKWYLGTLLKNADVITAASEGIINLLPIDQQRTSILPNGIEEKDDLGTYVPYEKFTISYTGSLYGKRSPEPLFIVLKGLVEEDRIRKTDLQIKYVGNHPEVWKSYLTEYHLEDYAQVLSGVEHAKALEIQQRSHINLLLTWASDEVQGWMTYKVYEYIRAQRPVLTLIQGSMDFELQALLHKYSHSLVLSQQDGMQDQLEQFVLENYAWYQKGTNAPTVNLHEFYSEYNWSVIAKRLEQNFTR